MRTRVCIFGAGGRLGRSISALAENEFLLVGLESADLYIDASLAPGVPEHVDIAVSKKRPIVIGVTALSEETHALMQEASHSIPLFYAPNFSLGIALLRKFAEQIAATFHPDADVDLIETHHAEKKDAPSGTALAIAAAIGKKTNIHSIRSGQIIGKHELVFNTAEEQLSITHTAHSRDVFARGALAAARFTLQQQPGFYTMDDLLQT